MARVTLSFDNGPTQGITDRVLDIVGARGVPATFFVIGEKLRRPPARRLAERAVAEGHRVGNHTLTHTVPLGELERRGDMETVVQEIEGAQELLGDLAPDRLFRPYGAGGVLDQNLIGPLGLEHLARNGYTAITWNCVPRDWLDPDGWVETAISMMATQTWSVVVLHDLRVGALDRLGSFIDRLELDDVEWRTDFPDDVRLVSVPS